MAILLRANGYPIAFSHWSNLLQTRIAQRTFFDIRELLCYILSDLIWILLCVYPLYESKGQYRRKALGLCWDRWSPLMRRP